MTTRKLPLEGIKVLDLSRVLAGPWATQILGDLGADIIKIERPDGGDETRAWTPPFLHDQDGNPTTEAAYYLCCNRNKRSVTMNLSDPQDTKLIQEMVKSCDVFVENFKVGGLKKYGLDYETLKQLNPSLIYCSITGFGQTGPMAHEPGYDFIIQGMGGLMSITGESDADGGFPEKAGVAITDVFTGLYAVIGILAALRERESSGLGQHLDLSLLDCHVAMLANQNLNFLTTGIAPQRRGNAHPNIVPYQTFASSDGYLNIAVGNDRQFTHFVEAIGQPQWALDEKYITNTARLRNREELVGKIQAILKTDTRDSWLEKMRAVGVPCGPINDIEQMFAMPQVVARHLRQDIPHPTAGTAPTVANPIVFSDTPVQYKKAPPLLGQHTEEVLKEFGLKK